MTHKKLEKQAKKNGSRAQGKDRKALAKRIQLRKGKYQANGFNLASLAQRFNVTPGYISRAICEIWDTEKAGEIRSYLDALPWPN